MTGRAVEGWEGAGREQVAQLEAGWVVVAQAERPATGTQRSLAHHVDVRL